MIWLREYGTRSGALKGWESRRRGYPRLGTQRHVRKIGKSRLGLGYDKLRRGTRAATVSKLITATGRTRSERQTENVLRKAGLLKSAKMGLGKGLTTKTGAVKYTLMSNDGKHIFTGAVLGMRQKLMSWHKLIGENLPGNFENWGPEKIHAAFMEWNKKSGGLRRVDRKIARYTKPIRRAK